MLEKAILINKVFEVIGKSSFGTWMTTRPTYSERKLIKVFECNEAQIAELEVLKRSQHDNIIKHLVCFLCFHFFFFKILTIYDIFLSYVE